MLQGGWRGRLRLHVNRNWQTAVVIRFGNAISITILRIESKIPGWMGNGTNDCSTRSEIFCGVDTAIFTLPAENFKVVRVDENGGNSSAC
jgi:hypothetical protein